ncbi:ABC transporter substrate-binding protein, partial [Streptococcus ferus]|uniref:ABC transporter substrate-binding protein n=1 Tax=Streptococcus ferus TaxID=1345 RepID=UPI00359FFA18
MSKVKFVSWWKWGTLVCLILAVGGWFYYDSQFGKIELRLGIYSGGSWDVPNAKEYELIDQVIERFEKDHPNVRVTYESGISKEDYSSWLSDAIVNGEQPDLFILPENDFNLLASSGSLKRLDPFIARDLEVSDFYDSAYQAGTYNNIQYALPFESNPTMMCINKDLLEKEGIEVPTKGWTLADFYNIRKKVTRDTDGDGVIDQYGMAGYTWQQALASYGIRLFDENGTQSYFNTEKVKTALSMLVRLNALNGSYHVGTEDFDKGRVAFLPMTLAQYRTYKPYPYHVAKYSSFSWTCIQMPAAVSSVNATEISTSLYGISAKTKYDRLAWEFLTLLTDDKATQQQL